MIYSKQNSYAVIGAAILLSFFASCAKADMVLGVGKSVVTLEPQGTWRQDTFEQDANTRSDSWMIGFESDISKHVGYRVAYHSWGRATLASGYLSGGDYRYKAETTDHCDGQCPSTNWAFSYQEAKGIELSSKFHVKLSGFVPYFRAGVVYYHVTQQTNVPDMGDADNADVYRRTFAVYNMSRNGLSGMAGVGVSYGRLGLEINQYPSVRAHDAAFRGVTEFQLTASVPF